MRKVIVLVIVSAVALFPVALRGNTLETVIRSLIDSVDAQVGVAVIIEGKDTVAVNDDGRYPLMSVVKFHQALAVADFLGRTGGAINDTVFVSKDMLRPDTYGPLRDKFPDGGVSVTVRGLLDYTLLLSDNNACDILFNYVGGTSVVDDYIRSLGVDEFAITATEDEMHGDLSLCYSNWSSPLAAASLVDIFLNGNIIRPDLQKYIKGAMIACSTGTDRLPVPLKGTGAVIGHKTGTGGRNRDGRIVGINDVGFVLLPDGRYYTIAVFVKDMAGDNDEAAHLIAEISAAVYHHVLSM